MKHWKHPASSRYALTPKGRERQHEYITSPLGRETVFRYRHSQKGQETKRRANASEAYALGKWRYERTERAKLLKTERDARYYSKHRELIRLRQKEAYERKVGKL